ncbi:MAG: YraN family protein [Ignavibacteria bacterium]|nr:YraN family protein [Bacteroidota bacterium]MBL7127815.1 YraN family protein [Ignavibacteria bacterium]
MPKSTSKNKLGKYGEEKAREFLESKGYELLTSNFRYDRAEVDLIFKDEKNKIIIFVEVKTRRNREFGEPEESINKTKQNQIKKAAEGFVSENEKFLDYDLRIDTVSVFMDGKGITINHTENAF